ncbi:MAG: hypothetical protein HFG98_13635 [Dorea sp.]|nr:hypothetical protein [Dorea sp.]
MRHKKIYHFILTAVLISAIILPLSGCTLAKKDAGEDAKDTLIGVFVTEEYLDLFGTDAYLYGQYANPLYATVNRHGSDELSDWEVSFQNIRGLNFLAPIRTNKDGESYRATQKSDGICHAHTDISSSDDKEELRLSATVYSIPKASGEDLTYFANPVYQTADGKIYTVPANGISISSTDSEGACMSTSISDQTETKDKWSVKTESTTVDMQFSVMYEPVRITLFQMGADNRILKQESHLPGKLPETLHAEKDAAYILVETEKKKPDGSFHIERNIYERSDNDDNSLETFYALDNGIVSKMFTDVIWEQ